MVYLSKNVWRKVIFEQRPEAIAEASDVDIVE